MSTTTIIDALKRGSTSELDFVKQLREGANILFDGMEAECFKRADALDELEDGLQDGGLLSRSTQGLLAKIHALEQENAVLTSEVKAWRLTAAAAQFTTQQNAPSAGFSKRKKALAKTINAAISTSNEAHTYNAARYAESKAHAAAEKTAASNLADAKQKSIELKQALNDLVDMVNDSNNSAAAQSLRTAMRRWGDIHRCLVAEREGAGERWGKQRAQTWGVFNEDRELIRELIVELRMIAREVGSDLSRVGEDAGL